MTGNTRWQDKFERFASAGSIAFGLLCGAGHALLIYVGDAWDARLALALFLVSAGVMGVSYFAVLARGRRTLPLLAEMLKLFFALWALIGASFLLRLMGEDPIPQEDWVAILVYFLTGTVAGTVWMFALLLIIGIKQNIAAWEVVRFPVWIADECRWLWNVITRR